jgi:selenophosphate synthase
MIILNDVGLELSNGRSNHMTDVTGFGLMGHLLGSL